MPCKTNTFIHYVAHMKRKSLSVLFFDFQKSQKNVRSVHKYNSVRLSCAPCTLLYIMYLHLYVGKCVEKLVISEFLYLLFSCLLHCVGCVRLLRFFCVSIVNFVHTLSNLSSLWCYQRQLCFGIRATICSLRQIFAAFIFFYALCTHLGIHLI